MARQRLVHQQAIDRSAPVGEVPDFLAADSPPRQAIVPPSLKQELLSTPSDSSRYMITDIKMSIHTVDSGFSFLPVLTVIQQSMQAWSIHSILPECGECVSSFSLVEPVGNKVSTQTLTT